MPRFLRSGRWALTPPFHPYPMTHEAPPGGIFSVTLSVVSGFRRRRPRLLRGLLPVWCPDFPLAKQSPRAAASRPLRKVASFKRLAREHIARSGGSSGLIFSNPRDW